MAFAKHIASKSRFLYSLRSILVQLFLFYLKFWARISLLSFHGTSIGIAGAVGKSTTKRALESILSSTTETEVIDGNSETGLPLGLLGLTLNNYHPKDWLRMFFLAPVRIFYLRRTRYLVAELGIDGPYKPKNMSYLLSIMKPHVAILLSESVAHSQNYEPAMPNTIKAADIEAQEQWLINTLLFDDGQILEHKSLETAIVDANDPAVYAFAKNHLPPGKLLTVGDSNVHDVVCHHYEISAQGTQFDFSVQTHQHKEFLQLHYTDVALPRETASSLAAAILTAVHLGIDFQVIQENLNQKFIIPPGRGTLFEGQRQTLLIDSSYNASPASMLSFLRMVQELKKQTSKPTAFICGDMLELGFLATSAHKQLAKQLPGVIDHLYCLGPLTKQYILPIAEKHKHKFKTISWFTHPKELIAFLEQQLPNSAIVLIKGSQTLEEVIKPLLLHSDQKQQLCRQNTFWEESKKKNGVWIQ